MTKHEMLEAVTPSADPIAIYDDDGFLRSEFLEDIERYIDIAPQEQLAARVSLLHEAEMGDVLEALDSDRRILLVTAIGRAFDFTSLTEVDEAVRREIVEALPNQQIAEAVQEIDSDDAVYILEDLEPDDQDQILARIPTEERGRLRRSLDYPQESAGRRMQTEMVAVPEFWTVGQTIDYMRNDENLPDRFHEIYVVGPTYELLGSIPLDQILRTKRDERIMKITSDTDHPIDADMDQEEAARVFERYDLVSAPVVDSNGRLAGVLTIDDVVDVIQQEADEDIKRMGGVGDEELSDSIFEITRLRFSWLFVNLVTAILASVVIGLFNATIEQMVALAVLMPVVASMGGNAGTQTMTVIVRALATRDMDSNNVIRIFWRECMVGLINGFLFALLIGIVASVWFENVHLGYVIAAAMVFNMICAAIAGVAIPVLLNRFEIDPAIASSVFVTTVTDVVGFFAFLGLASIWLI